MKVAGLPGAGTLRRAAGWGLGCAGVLVAIGFLMFVVALGIVLLAGRLT